MTAKNDNLEIKVTEVIDINNIINNTFLCQHLNYLVTDSNPTEITIPVPTKDSANNYTGNYQNVTIMTINMHRYMLFVRNELTVTSQIDNTVWNDSNSIYDEFWVGGQGQNYESDIYSMVIGVNSVDAVTLLTLAKLRDTGTSNPLVMAEEIHNQMVTFLNSTGDVRTIVISLLTVINQIANIKAIFPTLSTDNQLNNLSSIPADIFDIFIPLVTSLISIVTSSDQMITYIKNVNMSKQVGKYFFRNLLAYIVCSYVYLQNDLKYWFCYLFPKVYDKVWDATDYMKNLISEAVVEVEAECKTCCGDCCKPGCCTCSKCSCNIL